MDIKRIYTKKLFGTFDHVIKFSKDKITIIIGENGIGKTVMLQLIESIFSCNFDLIFDVDFEAIELSFTKENWIVKKRINDTNNSDEIVITSSVYANNPVIINKECGDDCIIDNLPSFFTRVGSDEWLDRRRDIIYSRSEVIRTYGFRQPSLFETSTSIPKWFSDRIEQNKVKLIKTQRLVQYDVDTESRRRKPELEHMVNRHSKNLVNLLKKENAVFTETSIKLDRTFPNRLLKQLDSRKKTDDITVIIERLNTLSEFRSMLSKVGIVEQEEDDVIRNLSDINDNILKVLSLYINDNHEKMQCFKTTANKLTLLLNIINKRFKHKKMSIDKDRGFIFTSTLASHQEIKVEKLSSGEQNELVLFYDLLFNCDSKHLVLIDEPEISLHITWQQSLINDLKEIVKENDWSILIATHSPDIIGENWSLVQTLSGNE